FTAPDHDYPSFVEIQLTAQDSSGLTSTVNVNLNPKTVNVTFNTNPSGLQLVVGSSSQATPFTQTVIQGSTHSVSAPTPQTNGSTTYTFNTWSDGGAQTHVITTSSAATYTADYTASGPDCSDSVGNTCVAGATAWITATQ